MNIDENNLPSFPPYEGNWAAILYEPIPMSGERITVAVAVWDADGCSMKATIPPGVLPEQMSGMIDLLVTAVRQQLVEGGIEGVSVPGIHVGHVRTGMGSNREDVLQQGVSLTCSLARRGD
jgi:hypothetical protein